MAGCHFYFWWRAGATHHSHHTLSVFLAFSGQAAFHYRLSLPAYPTLSLPHFTIYTEKEEEQASGGEDWRRRTGRENSGLRTLREKKERP